MIRIVLVIALCAVSAFAQEPTQTQPTTLDTVPSLSTDDITERLTLPSTSSSTEWQKHMTDQKKFRFKTDGDELDVRTIERNGKEVSFVDVAKPIDLGDGAEIVHPTEEPVDGTVDYQIGKDDDGNPIFVTLVLKEPPLTKNEPAVLKEKIGKLADPRVQQCGGKRTCTRWCKTKAEQEYCCEYTCGGG